MQLKHNFRIYDYVSYFIKEQEYWFKIYLQK